jgi:succinate-semialdehyde dehydrogenase / glutarate-semialdehyde dehydrogenase
MKAVNPATGKDGRETPYMISPIIQRKALELRKNASKWRKRTVKERLVNISKIRALLVKNKKSYSKLISEEMGKPIRYSISEIEKCIALCDYCISNAEPALRNIAVKTESKSFVMYEPLGTVLIVSPWNYPFWLALRPALQALCAGNTIILKHSSSVPGCAAALEKLFSEAGLKEHTMVVQTTPDSVSDLFEKNLVEGVLVIGGSITGSMIASKAAAKLKPQVLELGGSDPFIVFDDADLKEAAKQVVESRMLNSGQNCDSAKRLFVSKKVSAQFEHLLIQELSAIKIGDPMSEETTFGPLISGDACETMRHTVEDARNKGARLIYGGHRLNRAGFYFMPTLLGDVTSNMRAFHEEVFGPILPMATFTTEAEAIELANDTQYGLGASVWTKDKNRVLRLINSVRTGNLYFNRRVRSDIRMPFGGIKNSGYGRELGFDGFRSFTNVKSVVIS